MNEEKPTRILIADDHALFRRGLREFLQEIPDFEVVGEASNTQEAVKLTINTKPDIVLMDVHMPGGGGIEALKLIKGNYKVSIIMLTVSENDDDLMSAIEAGADGYLLKNAEPAQLCEAIRNVALGHSVLAPEVTKNIIRAAIKPHTVTTQIHLSPRQLEILTALAKGATTHEIAQSLVISKNTVKTHINHILRKLEVKNRAEAVAQAITLDILHITPE